MSPPPTQPPKLRYLGETVVPIATTPFAKYDAADWALYFVERFGQFDGGHHKQWVLDQITRIVHGTPVVIKRAMWSDWSIEWRVSTAEPSATYKAWVERMRGDGVFEYDEGIAP